MWIRIRAGWDWEDIAICNQCGSREPKTPLARLAYPDGNPAPQFNAVGWVRPFGNAHWCTVGCWLVWKTSPVNRAELAGTWELIKTEREEWRSRPPIPL